jgi:sarcosine oxidase
MSEMYDAIVVGLGGMGGAAACHLARRGQRVLGLERFAAGHARGSSHGGARIIRLAYFEDPAYVPLLLRAYELWRRLERDAAADLLLQTGGLMLGRPASPAVAGALRSAREWGLEHDLLDAAEIRGRFPTLAPGGDTVAFYETAAGLVRTEPTLEAHLRLAVAAGAECRFEEPVLSWDAAAGGVTVRTAVASYEAGRLVLCPGVFAPAVAGVPVRAERQLHTWFQPPGGVADFLPDRHPVWLWEPGEDTAGLDGYAYGFPALDGPAGGVKMNVTATRTACDPETVDRTVTEAEVAAAAAELARRLVDGPGCLVRAETCLFETTPDHHFVLGLHPAYPQVVVGAGFSGHGFKFVPVVGEILADLATEGTTSHPIALFDPERLGPAP